MSRAATLTRWTDKSTPAWTLGQLITDSGLTLAHLELGWDDNLSNVSCVPPGPGPAAITYTLHWDYSPDHGRYLYHWLGVSGRVGVEEHGANVPAQLRGCGAPGLAHALFTAGAIAQDPLMPPVAQWGVSSSDDALAALHKDMQDAQGQQVDFLLTVLWGKSPTAS